ncbi:unnamed protein product [Phaedon cochleariae]|uniref:CHK kinase-like domain-containing protein n=1 Tax=Phaedon cochleariae TaxID=80249 RepID=A0A9N9SNT1_PHACE|nr:unnamed protein product [Phaedon cochleariae]
MTSVELSAEQSQLIEKIASDNDFTDHQVKAITGSVKGDNYLGKITSVTVEDGNRKLELILKSAHVGEMRNQIPIHKAYMREIFVYEQVFAKFKEFQEEYRISEPFQSHPKLYATSDVEPRECLVMENLRESGYKLWNRKQLMNPEHISAVLKEYAKLHAVSFAMAEKKPEDFRKLAEVMKNHIWENDKELTATYIRSVMNQVLGLFEDDPDTTEVLKAFEKRLLDLFFDPSNDSENIVFDHGDCWCNNLMFGYENQDNSSVPSSVRIIDWQLSKLASPAMDLSYFFLVHSPKEVLYDYEKYLKLYHETLSKNLREFSCDPEKVFPYSVLLEHWKKRACLGVYTAFSIVKIMLCDSEDAPDLDEVVEGGKDLMEIFNFSPKDDGVYRTRIRDLVEFSIKTGLL